MSSGIQDSLQLNAFPGEIKSLRVGGHVGIPPRVHAGCY